MTNLRKRLDNVLAELAIIKEGTSQHGVYPACCVTIEKNGNIGCDYLGSLPEDEFLKQCNQCRKEIKSFLDKVYHSNKY